METTTACKASTRITKKRAWQSKISGLEEITSITKHLNEWYNSTHQQ